MNKLIQVIGFLALSLPIAAQVDDCSYAQFYKDSTYCTLGENVNIRLNPDTAGKVAYKASIGEKLRILEDTKIPYTQNGYTANWYQIAYTNNGSEAKGYIWGGFLASKSITSVSDQGIMYLYGVTRVVKLEYFDEVYLNLRVVKDNKQLQKLELKAVGSLRTPNTGESLGNKGVDMVTDILRLNFSDGYCAGSFGDIYLFWDGKTLHHAMTLTEGFDAPYYNTNVFVFPADEKGKKGYIINKSENGYSGDDDKVHIEGWERITYKWDGSKLVAVKTQKK